MAIDVLKETLVPLYRARKILPTKPSRWTVKNWANNGTVARNGQRVYLEVVKIGGTEYTTLEAFQR